VFHEDLYGFHSVPTGTTLPSTFHLGSIQFNRYVPSAVEIFSPVPDSALSGIGRKGIALSERTSDGGSLAITFPSSVSKVVLELEPDADHALGYEAKTSDYFFSGLSGALFAASIPPANRIEIDFSEPISTLVLKGKGFLYGVRVPTETRPPGIAPEDPVRETSIIYRVRYESTSAPSPPPFLGTVNLH
jgi:hypothetical protein